jgi:hypothetical protein
LPLDGGRFQRRGLRQPQFGAAGEHGAMKLPGTDKMKVEREKVVDYLLNAEHPDNGGKARFFLDLGFERNDWEPLAAALCKAAGNQPVSKIMASSHGVKYIVDGRIETPRGKAPMVRTVWIIDLGLDAPRLVTAYPREE